MRVMKWGANMLPSIISLEGDDDDEDVSANSLFLESKGLLKFLGSGCRTSNHEAWRL